MEYLTLLPIFSDVMMSPGESEGDHYYRCGDYVQAVTCYTQTINNKSANNDVLALAYNNRGHAKYMMVDFYAARDDYDVAIQLNPKLAVAYYNRATINYRMGDFALALQDFIICCQLNPGNTEYKDGLNSCQMCLNCPK